MLKIRAGWLAISVVAIATVLMVFFVLPRLSGKQNPVGEAINTAGKEVKDAVAKGGDAARDLVEPGKASDAAQPKTGQLAATKPEPAPAEQQAAKGALIFPTFDVLRVEPDGSTVIAGRAEPKSKLEVTDTAKTVARTDVDKAGEFVAILDEPLSPGDHQLVLKATTPDGRIVISQEVATVSVPNNKLGELLAMVTKPGEASRLIAVPNAGSSAAKAERVALSGAAGSMPQQQQGAPATPSNSAVSPSQATTGTPSATNTLASVSPVPAAPDTAPAGQKSDLQVTAVEIEGERLFIAGIAKSGTRVKGYADGQIVGEAQATGDGHFVIDGKINLSIGQHRISVDSLGANGQVLVRVEVPFNRPAGEQVAAVATPQSGAAALSQIDGGAFDKLRNEASRAFQLLSGLYANGNVPSLEQVAAARSAVSIALRSLTEYRLPAGIDANSSRIAENTAKSAAEALAALDALPRDVNSIGKNLGLIGEMVARAVGPLLPSNPASASEAQADPNAPRTIAQAPLTQSEAASVIIRRGDTLWQISRRVYGQGVRYTTIYVANQDQIRNPNIIQPGQIFGVPKDALPDDEAEKIHRKQMTKG